ncbi:uncharacterized protein isoform X1 [Rhodnius prolixus]|uniref:uncharacterized protein isoform X1 n=1 Tax=Rhodnius prolixus TaxID=13249 RepID=UPI003D18AD2C
MKFVYISYLFILIILVVGDVDAGSRRIKRQQAPPVANGEFLTQAFQVPVQTLTAVLNLLQATRGRIQAFHQAYQTAQQQHPNHHLNPHFTFKQKDKTNYSFNSKALVQPKKNRK